MILYDVHNKLHKHARKNRWESDRIKFPRRASDLHRKFGREIVNALKTYRFLNILKRRRAQNWPLHWDGPKGAKRRFTKEFRQRSPKRTRLNLNIHSKNVKKLIGFWTFQLVGSREATAKRRMQTHEWPHRRSPQGNRRQITTHFFFSNSDFWFDHTIEYTPA